jgi:hypothetical protein
VSKKGKNSQRGATTILTVTALGIILAAALQYQSSHLVQKKKFILKELASSNQQGLLEQVVARTVTELGILYRVAPPTIPGPQCTLDRLLIPASTRFNGTASPIAPRIYGKGQFQMDILDVFGNPTGRFTAPEEDVRAYIQASTGGGFYPLVITTTFCGVEVRGRTKFAQETGAAPSPGLGVAWAQPCPTDKRIPIEYRSFVNAGYFGSNPCP